MSRILKKTVWLLLGCCVALFVIFLCRTTILQAFGNFLIVEDKLQRADAIFVLGGNSYDRGNAAVKLFSGAYADKIICLGENIPIIFKTLNLSYAESELSKMSIVSSPVFLGYETKNISDTSVIVLKKGTSTKEEVSAIIDYCLAQQYKKIIIVSSQFHTRRVNMIFREQFEKNAIELILSGAPSFTYSEQEWWKTEEGLIMVNNEYVKLFYYLVKY